MINLRRYQEWLRHDILQALKTHKSVLAVSPTGSGKTVSIADLCLLAIEHGRKVLIVTNRRLLVTQMADKCREHGVHYGVIMADLLEGDPAGPVQIGSLQTLESWHFVERFTGEKTGHGLPDANLIVIDEADQEADGRYATLRSFYPDAKVLGLTATPVGAQGRCLVPGSFDCLVEGPRNSELIYGEERYLLPTRVIAPSEPHLDGVKLSRISDEKLGQVIHRCTVFSDIFKEWEPFQDRKAVIFAPGIPFGGWIEQEMNRKLGPGQFRLIEAKTKLVDRDRILGDIKEGRSKGAISVGVLTRGWDMPEISLALDLQPRSQMRDYWQKVGRIKRPFQGQQEAILVDMAGEVWRHNLHPDCDPEWPVGDQSTSEVADRKRESPSEPKLLICPKCKHERMGGKSCPQCGFEWDRAVRWIRMGDGRLKEISAETVAKRKTTDAERLFNKWQSQLFRALKANLTYGQCAAIFKKETGSYPASGWPGVHEPGSAESKRRPGDTMTPGKLSFVCKEAKRRLQ